MAITALTGQDSTILKEQIRELVKDRGINLMGVADMAPFLEPGADIPEGTRRFLSPYSRAVVLGIPWGIDSGRGLLGNILEPLAFSINCLLWDGGFTALTVHGDDEFDPAERRGLISLKALAKQAGLGWQGRSLLIINPDHGPLHRVIAIMTDLPLEPDRVLKNRCGRCSACVDACPEGALSLVEFVDHPDRRKDVLEVSKCIGNDTCPHCIQACPWLRA